MRWVVRLLGLLVILAVIVIGGVMGASELGGEVIVLHTRNADGGDQVTRVWVIDDGGFAWIRSGVPTSSWFLRLQANPEVVVERAGRSSSHCAVLIRTAEARDRINARMREKYGLADELIAATRDGSQSIAIRLEPVAMATDGQDMRPCENAPREARAQDVLSTPSR